MTKTAIEQITEELAQVEDGDAYVKGLADQYPGLERLMKLLFFDAHLVKLSPERVLNIGNYLFLLGLHYGRKEAESAPGSV